MSNFTDHKLRFDLTNELHARPFPTFGAPGSVAFLALKVEKNAAARDKTKDTDLLIKLLDRFGAPHPQHGATHYSGGLGRNSLKWEQHTEFVTYTIYSPACSERAFDPAVFDVFPDDWIEEINQTRITSANIRLEIDTNVDQISTKIQSWFVPESLAISYVLDQSLLVAADFRIDESGHQRFAVFASNSVGERRIGRVVQRLCEIETYKTLSMLGFAKVKEMQESLEVMDAKLTNLISSMKSSDCVPENTLKDLLAISTDLENLEAQTSFRFGATEAYEAIVNQRIEVLREERFSGRQNFKEFMMRRYEPAMRTVNSVQNRLQATANRARRAGELLRTRVDVDRSAQNQILLESMDKRADQQLKLQKTVEGFSVVAISYYAVSLISYLGFPFAETLGISKAHFTAIITLPVIFLVWMSIRRIRSNVG